MIVEPAHEFQPGQVRFPSGAIGHVIAAALAFLTVWTPLVPLRLPRTSRL